jgi:hypothetical protein
VRRDPPVSPQEHLCQALGEVNTPLFAFLHDDDWWGPTHLATGLAELCASPLASAYYSSYFIVNGYSGPLQCHDNLGYWFAAGFPDFSHSWPISVKEAILACLVHTPSNYSSLLAKTDIMRLAISSPEWRFNPYDNDRWLPVALARHGPILFNPMPEVFALAHPGQESRQPAAAIITAQMIRTTEQILDYAMRVGVDVRAEITQRLESCPPSSLWRLYHTMSNEYCSVPLVQRNLAPSELRRYTVERYGRVSLVRSVIDLLKLLLPPILVHWARSCVRTGSLLAKFGSKRGSSWMG